MPRGLARDHDAKRAALRKAAARVFAAHGFDRASMAGLAGEAGVSKALLYHYWPAKEALLFDILDTHLGHLVEVAEAALEAGGARPLDVLVPAILDAYEDADAEHRLQLESLSVLPPEHQAPLLAHQRALIRLMGEALRRECPAACEVPDRLRALTMTAWGILNWVYMWHRPGKGLSRAEYGDLAVRFIRGGLAANAEGPDCFAGSAATED